MIHRLAQLLAAEPQITIGVIDTDENDAWVKNDSDGIMLKLCLVDYKISKSYSNLKLWKRLVDTLFSHMKMSNFRGVAVEIKRLYPVAETNAIWHEVSMV